MSLLNSEQADALLTCLWHDTSCRSVTKGGKQYLEPCSGGTAGAIETDLNKLADEGKASMVAPPSITMSMMRKVLEKARPTVSQSDLETYQKFTKEFGEEG